MNDFIKSEFFYTVYVYSMNGNRVRFITTDSFTQALSLARNSGYTNWQIEQTRYITNLPF